MLALGVLGKHAVPGRSCCMLTMPCWTSLQSVSAGLVWMLKGILIKYGPQNKGFEVCCWLCLSTTWMLESYRSAQQCCSGWQHSYFLPLLCGELITSEPVFLLAACSLS